MSRKPKHAPMLAVDPYRWPKLKAYRAKLKRALKKRDRLSALVAELSLEDAAEYLRETDPKYWREDHLPPPWHVGMPSERAKTCRVWLNGRVVRNFWPWEHETTYVVAWRLEKHPNEPEDATDFEGDEVEP